MKDKEKRTARRRRHRRHKAVSISEQATACAFPVSSQSDDETGKATEAVFPSTRHAIPVPGTKNSVSKPFLAARRTSPQVFLDRLRGRLCELKRELGGLGCTMPVGLFFVVDEEHGGDAVAEELVRRAKLIDRESKDHIDFYYLGWMDDGDGWRFDLDSFSELRDFFGELGIRAFEGNADLVLFDARISSHEDPRKNFDNVYLDFSQSIHVNLSRSIREKKLPGLGDFLQSVMLTADEIQCVAGGMNPLSPTACISNRIGAIYAKESLLAYILKRWGALFGAEKLALVATEDLGPRISLDRLMQLTPGRNRQTKETSKESKVHGNRFQLSA